MVDLNKSPWDDEKKADFTSVPSGEFIEDELDDDLDSDFLDEEDLIDVNQQQWEDLSSEQQDAYSLLEGVLAKKSDIFATKILQLIWKLGIKPDDPIFLIILAFGELELLLVNVPYTIEELLIEYGNQLGELFQQYFGATEEEAKQRFLTALQEEKAAIAEAAKEVVITTRKEQFQGNLLTLGKMFAPAMGVMAFCIGIGAFGMAKYTSYVSPQVIAQGDLTVEQYQHLTWAMSDEGKLARKIMSLNKGYVGETCKKDAEAMGLTLVQGGRKVKSGFCTLFVDEVGDRKYE